jgi:hypothetical protein
MLGQFQFPQCGCTLGGPEAETPPNPLRQTTSAEKKRDHRRRLSV